ncbi:MAG: alkaline shock response membrane anchor protein AmaP [Clostridia bacterium]|nr:alkaline shock response membrane anchor protein AmaP [Clostridia bacterium]
MKDFEKFLLVIFSIIVIVFVATAVLISVEMVDTSSLLNLVKYWLVDNRVWVISVGAIFAMLALVGIFSNSENEENVKSGLAIKNESGTVYITKDTFENIILNVTRNFASLRNIRVAVNIDESGISTNVYVYILPDTVVPTVTAKLQENIKEAILKQTTVEIKEANIKIKGVYVQPEKKA